MMARVQLDASHVSRCVTARREKVPRYIRVSQRTSEVRTFRLSSLRLRVLEYTVSENWFTVPWEFLSVTLEVFDGSVTDLGVGVRSAAAAPLCSFAGSWGGSWRRTEVDAVHTSIQVWRGKLQRYGQQAGSAFFFFLIVWIFILELYAWFIFSFNLIGFLVLFFLNKKEL